MRESFYRAFTDVYPYLIMDFSKVIISKWSLVIPESFATVAAAGATLTLSWTDNSDELGTTVQDALMVGLTQNWKGVRCLFPFTEGAKPQEPLSCRHHGDRSVEVLAFFKSGYVVSDTVHGGNVVIQA